MAGGRSVQSDLRVSIGERVRVVRISRGLTQSELALRASMNRNHLGEVERGETNVTVQTVTRIAQALGVPVESLFSH